MKKSGKKISYDAHVSKYESMRVMQANFDLYQAMLGLLEKWKSGNHLLGRYEGKYGGWSIALRHIEEESDTDPVSSEFIRKYWIFDHNARLGNTSKLFTGASVYGELTSVSVSLLISESTYESKLQFDLSLQRIRQLFLDIPILNEDVANKLHRHFDEGRREMWALVESAI